jgi:hypothetical protein
MFWDINTCRGCKVHATIEFVVVVVVVVVVVALLVLSLSCQECQRQMHNVWTCRPHFCNTLVIVKWHFDICQIVNFNSQIIQLQKISNSCCDRQTKKKRLSHYPYLCKEWALLFISIYQKISTCNEILCEHNHWLHIWSLGYCTCASIV